MRDVFGYIAYGENELYHRGALLSALKLLYHCPEAKIIVATDRPELFVGYPMETLLLTDMQKEAWSFSGQYHFGIKARALIKLLRMTDRLIFMDSDHYPAGFLSLGFESISPKHSVMRRLEKPHKWTPVLEGEGLRIGEHVITGREPMWQSGILGVHRDNLPALMDAYPPMLAVHQISKIDAAEQFCIGIALSLGGRTISPHKLKIRDYNTRGKKAFAEPRVHRFFDAYAAEPVARQIVEAGRYRVWRTPVDIIRQKLKARG
ncbi:MULTISPECIES: hypothetical protein [unclassified Mesorhizobium]|uniref:hypothetical protein n=1 Tax=unclassified Mesorhizobium TaxID=325217 RepID=UPI0003CFB833|nr:hypothetical protein [Mesorhizobium sp. L103C105A0]ESZ78539.1 hypothetical protein X726_05155 [Mesorhizobium sp. L103C105A0]